MLGKTDNTASPSYGKAIIVKEFSQFLFSISTKNINNNETIARTTAKNPITDSIFNFSIL